MSTREIPGPSFLLSNKMKGYNLQLNRCNFLFFLSQSPLSEYNIHDNTQPAIQFPHKRGFPSREKNPKNNFYRQICDLIMNDPD
jgi:hypothetical protein